MKNSDTGLCGVWWSVIDCMPRNLMCNALDPVLILKVAIRCFLEKALRLLDFNGRYYWHFHNNDSYRAIINSSLARIITQRLLALPWCLSTRSVDYYARGIGQTVITRGEYCRLKEWAQSFAGEGLRREYGWSGPEFWGSVNTPPWSG